MIASGIIDTPSPEGPLAESYSVSGGGYDCVIAKVLKYCTYMNWAWFSTRPLVTTHTFGSFKFHLYVKPGSCPDPSIGTCVLTIGLASLATVNGNTTLKNKSRANTFVHNNAEVVDAYTTNPITVLTGEQLYVMFGDPFGDYLDRQPVLQFGDAMHASYVETDFVSFEGQPIPELSLPSVMLALSLLAAFAVLRRDRLRATGKPDSHL